MLTNSYYCYTNFTNHIHHMKIEAPRATVAINSTWFPKNSLVAQGVGTDAAEHGTNPAQGLSQTKRIAHRLRVRCKLHRHSSELEKFMRSSGCLGKLHWDDGVTALGKLRALQCWSMVSRVSWQHRNHSTCGSTGDAQLPLMLMISVEEDQRRFLSQIARHSCLSDWQQLPPLCRNYVKKIWVCHVGGRNSCGLWCRIAHSCKFMLVVSWSWLEGMVWDALEYSRLEKYRRSHRHRTCNLSASWVS